MGLSGGFRFPCSCLPESGLIHSYPKELSFRNPSFSMSPRSQG